MKEIRIVQMDKKTKRTYRSPILREIGKVHDVTKGGSGDPTFDSLWSATGLEVVS